MLRWLSALFAMLLWLPPPAQAQNTALPTTDLLLALMVDASGSVNQYRFELQRKGYADAFRNKQVLNAIRGGANGSIAALMVQWTGYNMQAQAVPWMLIKDDRSAHAFADSIEAAPRQLFGGGTSISGAIDYSIGMLVRAPFQAARRIIDVSGDGANNRGRPAEDARDAAVAAGITVNGLPILTLEPDLDAYYRQSVIGGPGAFVIVAHSYEEFAIAIRSKLVIEIAGASSGEHVVDVGLDEVRGDGRFRRFGPRLGHHP
jgi:hypothetical protein